jgi:hypothetical protein
MKPETEPEVLSADGSEPVSLVPRGEEDMLEMPDGTFVTRDEFESAMNKGRRMAQARRIYQIRANRERRRGASGHSHSPQADVPMHWPSL